ncbi:hypothetical protein BGZ47_008702 [Haplosporangium gracile]|nr:hypothetical protein BGZ47_008702 [Haplosporangium gracile]
MSLSTKYIEILKKKEVLPAEATGTIELSLLAIQNFLELNRVCGQSRYLEPMSSMKDRFITLTEFELVELFWRNPALKSSRLDDPLTETQNVIRTKEDVARFWGCPSSEIKILAIDLGKEFLVGASAFLPPKKSAASAVSTRTSAPQYQLRAGRSHQGRLHNAIHHRYQHPACVNASIRLHCDPATNVFQPVR